MHDFIHRHKRTTVSLHYMQNRGVKMQNRSSFPDSVYKTLRSLFFIGQNQVIYVTLHSTKYLHSLLNICMFFLYGVDVKRSLLNLILSALGISVSTINFLYAVQNILYSNSALYVLFFLPTVRTSLCICMLWC